MAVTASGDTPSNVTTNRKSQRKPRAKPEPIPYQGSSNPEVDEQTAVHEVYERIAPHFSQTRHKAWPLIVSFLQSLPPHSIGLDSGGGNGKYVPVAREAGLEMVVMDRSSGLLRIAREQGFGDLQGDQKRVGECIRGDLCGTSWRRGTFDFAISIAAIHHLSTPDRRRRAVQALIQPLVHSSIPPYSRFLIYVWAYEQGAMSKRKMGTTAHSSDGVPSGLPSAEENLGSQIGGMSECKPALSTGAAGRAAEIPPVDSKDRVQDVLVPWVLQPSQPPKPQAVVGSKSKAGQRLKGDPSRSRDPGAPAYSTGTSHGGAQTGVDPDDQASAQQQASQSDPQPEVFHRYYHLSVQGELRELVQDAAADEGYVLLGAKEDGEGAVDGALDRQNDARGHAPETRWLRVRKEGWEADNWWLEGEVGVF